MELKPKNESKVIVTQDKKDIDNSWNDQLEAVQFITKVETKIHDYINSDLVLAYFDADEREFVINQTALAFAAARQVPDKEVQKRVFMTIMIPVLMRALTKRNVPKNVLMSIVGGSYRGDDPDEQDVMQQSLWDKGREQLGKVGIGKKKGEVIEQ